MILFCATAHAQLYQSMPQSGYYFNRGWFEGLLTIPTNNTQLSNITGGRDVGRIRYNVDDSSVQIYTGYQWLAANRSTGANTALSNLASVAINTSLLPGTTDAIDLGSASKQWRSIYLPNTDNSSTLGVIFKGGNRFFHNFKLTGTDGENTFMGNLSGNFTMTGSSGIQGSYNTGYGVATLYSNTTGFRNAAFGTYALQNNTTGFSNNAFGQSALFLNTTGFNNSAIGTRALNFNTTGTSNSAHGTDAGFANTTGSFNFFGCIDAGYQNTTGSYNTYVGDSTFWIGTIGIKNTGIGSRAGYYLGDTYPNFASVKDSMVTFLGADASRDSSVANTTALKNLTVIGYNAKGYASNQVVLGNTDVTTTLLKGNIGIGTLTPAVALDVTGTTRLNNLTASQAVFTDANKNLVSNAISGTGSVAMTNSPTFVTPALGTPSSGILTNATGLPEGGLSTTDITTNNATTSKHGFLPKLTANSIYYVNNGGSWTGLTVGAANTVLAGNGVTSAPSWLATSSLTGLPYWPLTGTGTLTGNTTIDGSGGPYNVTIKSNPGGLLRADGNVVTIGDPDVAQTGALMRIDAGAGTAYILSTAISGGSNGDAITLIDNTTGELGVAPNLAFNLQKQGTEIYASNGLIFAKDKAGNKTQISPHNKNGDWVYNSTNAKGSTTEINMTDAIKTIEQLTKRVYELEKKLNIKTTKPKKLIHKK